MSSRRLIVYLALLGIAMAQDTRRRPDLTCENVRLKEIHDIIKYQTDIEVDAVSEINKDLRDINNTIKEQTSTQLEIITTTNEKLQAMDEKLQKLQSIDAKLDAIQVEIHNGFQEVINIMSSIFRPVTNATPRYVTNTTPGLVTNVTQGDCFDVQQGGQSVSGIYTIQPFLGGQFDVYCDMDKDSGGWTVLQRREDGSVDFYLYWDDYKRGFGDLNGEFWLGNDYIHQLTRSREYELRVDLEDFDGNIVYAKYSSFSIDDERNKYKLHVGSYSGDAGDSMTYHDGMFFSTRDRDNDEYSSGDCAESYTGAWWYNNCYYSNLNGQYLAGQTSTQGVVWKYWKNTWESLKHVEMKIRPVL